MEYFNGIAISETRLLVQTIILSVLVLGCMVAMAFLLAASIRKSDPKGARRLKNLRKRAKKDPAAAQEYERLKRKKKNKRRRNTKALVGEIVLWVLLSGVFLFSSAFTLGGWLDYCLKDYQVYVGDFEVSRSGKSSVVFLGDGTQLTGHLGLDEGEHNGTVVYSRRVRETLGYK